jgi:hypothetical protein
MPSAASGDSPRAVKAFARHYFELVSYAINSGDTAPLRAVGADGCDSCEAIAGNIDDIYAEGGRIESKGWRVDSLRYLGKQRGNRVVSVGAYLEAETVVQADGSEDRNPGGRQPMTMYVSQRDAMQVARLDLVT